MWAKSKQSGFTIVELLIVIVVIAILAAIVIMAYNGVQQRARASAAARDLSMYGGKMQYGASTSSTGQYPTTLEIYNTPDYAISSVTQGNYSLVSYCASNNNGFVLAAQTQDGNKYYVKSSNNVVQDNTINVVSPCAGLNVKNIDASTPSTTFIGMPSTNCATENGTCNFNGTVSIAYGSVAQGKFTAKANMTSPVSCSNTTFGDPASGFAKACYLLDY
jgi:prepilin-type N-terminal cleavage/methylation domain-containing protein